MASLKSTEKYTIANLHYLMTEGKLFLNPEYQREAVWTTSQKRLLIDSILRDIDIPKLYFRNKANASYDFEVVDGQQRLLAIRDFMNDKLSIDDDADPVDGVAVASTKFSKLDSKLYMKFQNAQLDIVVFNTAATDDYIEDMFTRLQNGTPLNAAEKRRALPGNMRTVVKDLSTHKAFYDLVGITNYRYAHEDAVAKGLQLIYNESITDIKHASIVLTYKMNAGATDKSPFVVKYRRAMNFLHTAFKGGPSPQFKKYELVSLPYLVLELLDNYDLQNHAIDFARAYLDLSIERAENAEKEEVEQDPRLVAYDSAARSDRVQDMQYRHDFIKQWVLSRIPELVLKDSKRDFSDDQRLAIYIKDKGTCQECGTHCEQSNFHADHISPHSRGGQTKISNGQVLCPECNLKKSSSVG